MFQWRTFAFQAYAYLAISPADICQCTNDERKRFRLNLVGAIDHWQTGNVCTLKNNTRTGSGEVMRNNRAFEGTSVSKPKTIEANDDSYSPVLLHSDTSSFDLQAYHNEVEFICWFVASHLAVQFLLIFALLCNFIATRPYGFAYLREECARALQRWVIWAIAFRH